jgi:FlaA1/EpsC-like NDP-sugar epimerase
MSAGGTVSFPDVLLAPVRTLRSRKRVARFLADCLLWVAALYTAVLIRLDFEVARLDDFEVGLLIPAMVIFQGAAGYWNGLYRGWWINGSFEEVAALARTAVLTTVGILLVDVLFPDQHLAPVSSVLAAGIIAFVAMGGARYGARQVLERRRREIAKDRTRARAVVFGAGEGGERIIRAMLSDSASPFVPVALLDDDPSKRNLTIRSVRVAGDRSDLEAVAQRFEASALVIAVPSADGAFVRELSAAARAAHLDVRVVPSVTELLGSDVSVTDLREPTEADLLGRHKVETDLLSVSEYVRGKTVVVTGAGGSIGSELCRQLSRFEPGRLVMIDRDESGLHAVQLSLEGRALLDSDSLVLLDIRDRTRVARLFAEIKPDVVFHAAALKHLPLLEAHPSEAVKTNIWGTLAVLDAAAGAGVSLVVNISTDKAADAQSVLGYSKRVAEGLTAHFGLKEQGRYLSVRFGNVLGSRGSVLTAFRAQLEQGGPLTVTHPDVTRYFMTIEEAVQLVIQAGAIGSDGQALVLDMGEPVKIHDVARQLAASCTPEVPIEFTGLRPGEKLHEALFCSHEQPQPSRHELILSVDVAPFDPEFVRDADPARPTCEVLAELRAWAGAVDELSRGLPARPAPGVAVDLTADEAAAL